MKHGSAVGEPYEDHLSAALVAYKTGLSYEGYLNSPNGFITAIEALMASEAEENRKHGS